jgi:hypothetical protein
MEVYMKQLLYGNIAVFMLCACTAQAYTLSVKNFTPQKNLPVAIQLKGFGQKPSATQIVDWHPMHENQMIKRDVSKIESNVATFSFTGLKSGLCVNKILVHGNSLKIYGVESKRYKELQTTFDNNYAEFKDEIEKDIKNNRYTDMSQSPVGICFSRQFDIVQRNTGELIIIAQEML